MWGGMAALATIAPLRGEYLCGHFEAIKSAIESGSVIARDSGVRVVAAIASKSEECRDRASSYLLQHLSTCRSKDVPQHSESALPAVSSANRDEFLAALEARMAELTPRQAKRVEKVMRQAHEISTDGKE